MALGRAFALSGRQDDAIRTLEMAISSAERALPADHLELTRAREALAAALQREGTLLVPAAAPPPAAEPVQLRERTGGDGNYEDIPARDLGGLTPFDPEPAPTLLRPGCRGQDGAGAALGARGGRGGPAGGAVYVAAKAGITINGTIAANGAGGMGGGAQAGGGGGGSGGMISLEAPTVARNGKLFANGGGGGEGGIFAAGEVLGESGADGRQDTMFAAGGASALPGKGGDGGARSRPGGEDGTFTNEAGAGGGGGIGVIRVLGATTLGPAAVESPAVTVN